MVRNTAKCVYLLFLVFYDTLRLGISMPTFFISSSQIFNFLNGIMQNERTLNMRVLYHGIGLWTFTRGLKRIIPINDPKIDDSIALQLNYNIKLFNNRRKRGKLALKSNNKLFYNPRILKQFCNFDKILDNAIVDLRLMVRSKTSCQNHRQKTNRWFWNKFIEEDFFQIFAQKYRFKYSLIHLHFTI